MPPSHAGMVPAALPAFSPPRGVRVVPSLARSAAESSAAAGNAMAQPAESRSAAFLEVNFMSFLLERVAHAERVEIPVAQRVRIGAPRSALARRDGAARRRRVGAAEDASAEEGRRLHVHLPL